jgi:hypothetical protein
MLNAVDPAVSVKILLFEQFKRINNYNYDLQLENMCL